MADYDYRVPLDFRFGTLQTSIGTTDVSLISEGFRDFPADLSTEKYVPVALVDEVNDRYEVVWVTGHADTSSTVTVVRACEESVATSWPSGTVWRVAATTNDVTRAVSSQNGGWPAYPHIGQHIVDPFDGQQYIKTATDWVPFPYIDRGTSLGEVVLTGPAGGVNWNNIPQTYRHLVLYYAANTPDTVHRVAKVYLNNRFTTEYDFQGAVFSGSTVSSFRFNGSDGMETGPVGAGPGFGSSSRTVITNYTGTLNSKVTLTDAAYPQAPGVFNMWKGVGLHWPNGDPITSLRVDCDYNFGTGSYFGLFGVR